MTYALEHLRKEQLLTREIEQLIQSPTIPRNITTVKIIREKIGGHHFECIHGVRTRVNTTKDHNRSETTVAVDEAATSQVIEAFLNQLNPKLNDLLKCIKEQYVFYSDIVRFLSCVFYIYRRPDEPGPGSPPPPSTVSLEDVAVQLGRTIRPEITLELVMQMLLDIGVIHERQPGKMPPSLPGGGTPETQELCTASSLASSMAMGRLIN